MSNLLPAAMTMERSAVLVADSLAIPRHPHPPEAVRLGQLNTRAELLTQSNVVEDLPLGDSGERVALVDKAHPHAVRDMMMISAGDEVVSSLYDHSDSFTQGVLAHTYQFASHAKQEGMSPVIAWSYDPDTNDRASGQGEKRFHAHLMARSPDEVQRVHDIERPLGELTPLRQRRIADEFSVVAAYALYDASEHESLPGIELVEPFSTPASKLCLQFGIEGGWEGLRDNTAAVSESLTTLDRMYKHLFTTVLRATTVGEYGHWQRPVLVAEAGEKAVSAAEAMGLRPETAQLIGHYVGGLHGELVTPERSRQFASHPRSDLSTYLYPLGGVSYTTCFAEKDGEPRGHFRANMFTDLGGAGVSMVDGVMTKVTKACGTMSASEYADRQAFQDKFVNNLGQ
jgi:hypothetical protein